MHSRKGKNMFEKRKIWILSLVCLFCLGCATIRGPISKKFYYSPEDPKYKQEILDFNRKEFVLKHSQLPEAIKQCILKGSLLLGMDKDQVRASLGEPWQIYRSVSGKIINEQWMYEPQEIEDSGRVMQNRILYFDNGILKSWQE